MKVSGLALYVHIPFCVQKCSYCDFASHANAEEHIDDYIDALENEVRDLSNLLSYITVKTVYIGGGTPTLLRVDQLERIFKILYKHIHMDALQEFTIEANPGTINVEKLALCKEYAINRISLGVQSLQQRELHELGRIHSVHDVYQTVDQIKSFGFQNWSLDLMYGLPCQSIESWQDTLDRAISLEPMHLSIYNLKIEEDTPFYHLHEKGEIHLPEEDDIISMYRMGQKILRSNGYSQYEISNFSKDSYQSQHNMVYWNNHNYLGIGSNSWSYITNIRYQNQGNIIDYIEQYKNSVYSNWETLLQSKSEVQVCSLNCQMEDFVMLGLRKIDGLSVADFNTRYRGDFHKQYNKQIEEFVAKKLLMRTEQGYRLTEGGLLLANEVMLAFFE